MSKWGNGYNDFVNNCELSDFEDVTSAITRVSPSTPPSAADYTCPYDGFIIPYCGYGAANNSMLLISTDGMAWKKLNGKTVYEGICVDGANVTMSVPCPVKKGWKIALDSAYGSANYIGTWALFYKKRDYSNR